MDALTGVLRSVTLWCSAVFHECQRKCISLFTQILINLLGKLKAGQRVGCELFITASYLKGAADKESELVFASRTFMDYEV